MAPDVMHLPIHGSALSHCCNGAPHGARGALKRQAVYRHSSRLCYDRPETIVPHKRLWRLTDADGAEIACDLETLTSNRILLTVKRNGDQIVTETFSDKRDALARSVGIYKEMKPPGRP